jgi:flavin reductase
MEDKMTTVSSLEFREGMARLGAAVNIVTTSGPAGRYGLTASAVCSVTDTPPTLLVCMKRSSRLRDFFHENGVLCVNALTADQQPLSAMFAGQTERTMEERFEASEWKTLTTGAPVLLGAIASFDTRIARIVEVGTHTIFFCEVMGVQVGKASSSLVYFERSYHGIHSSNQFGKQVPLCG